MRKTTKGYGRCKKNKVRGGTDRPCLQSRKVQKCHNVSSSEPIQRCRVDPVKTPAKYFRHIENPIQRFTGKGEPRIANSIQKGRDKSQRTNTASFHA